MEFFVEWGFLGLFLAAFLAATILPLSSEAVLSLLIVYKYNVELCYLVATLGNWLGGMSGYGLGYLSKNNWIERYFGIAPAKVEKWTVRADKHGGALAFFCWLPVVGDLIAVALGVVRANWIKVSIGMFLGKAVRYIVWGYGTIWIMNNV